MSIAELLTTWSPPAGSVGLVWLGQSGFALRSRNDLVLLDPFWSPHADRVDQPDDPPDRFAGVTAVLATHEHLDHLDAPAWPALASASPAARFVVAAPLVPTVRDLGIASDRVLGALDRAPIEIGEVTITPVPACHAVEVEDGCRVGPDDGSPARWLGYVVEIERTRFYHAGDTIRYPHQAEIVQGLDPDVLLLPINGRDAEREARGIVGNLDAREAVELATDIGAPLTIPMHYSTMRGNLGDVGEFARRFRTANPARSSLLPGLGQPVVVSAGTGGRSESMA